MHMLPSQLAMAMAEHRVTHGFSEDWQLQRMLKLTACFESMHSKAKELDNMKYFKGKSVLDNATLQT